MSAPTALQAGSLASAVSQGTTTGQPLTLKLELGHREPLQGKELEAFYASRAAHALLEEEEEEPQPSLTPRYLPDSPSCGQAKQTEQHLLSCCLAEGQAERPSQSMNTTVVENLQWSCCPVKITRKLPATPDMCDQCKCVTSWCRFSSGSIGKASRTSSNAARLGLLPEEPEEDEDMYEAPMPTSDILVDGFIVPKVEKLHITPRDNALSEEGQ